MVNILCFQCRGPGSVPGQGTRFHMPQLRHGATKKILRKKKKRKIDMNIVERQIYKQIHSFINIAEESISMSKAYWFVEPLRDLSLRQNLLNERV